jgi:hypothetical protein
LGCCLCRQGKVHYTIDIRSWLNLDGQLQEVAKDYSDDDVSSQWVEEDDPCLFCDIQNP